MLQFIPENCPDCDTKLKVITGKNDKFKLMCPNAECVGKEVKKFCSGMLVFQISGLGEATLKNLYLSGIRDIADLLSMNKELIFKEGYFKEGRAFDKIIESIDAIKSLRLKDIIESLQFDNIGHTVSEEIEKYVTGGDYDFTGIDYSIRDLINNPASELNLAIQNIINKITVLGIPIEMGKKKSDKKMISFEMTGSPENYGWKTKDIFELEVAEFGCERHSLSKKSDYLVTDDLSSTTGKMEKANNFGIKIVDYKQFYEIVSKL